MKFQSAKYASVFLAVHPVQPLRLDVLLRLRKLGISSSDNPSDSAVPLFLLSLFHPVSQSPVRLAQFTFSSLSSSPICFQSVTQCSDLSAYLPLVCIPVAVCLSFSLYLFLFFSLPLQGISAYVTVPECWTLRWWSVHLRTRFIQRWGDKSSGGSWQNDAVLKWFSYSEISWI